MLLQILAAALLLVFLWSVFRFAMGLRWAKLSREELGRAEAARGRRVVAEIPLADDLLLFVEDAHGFHWGAQHAGRGAVLGGRVLLNGGVIGSFARPGVPLPEPPAPEDYQGRERWDVILYVDDGCALGVPCGSLREGVSREIAMRVFEAVRHGIDEKSHGGTQARRNER